MTPVPVTAQELLTILKDHSVELERLLTAFVPRVQLSIPTDGRGVRLHVSVDPGYEIGWPSSSVFNLNGNLVDVPLEVAPDFQDYEAYS